MSNNRWREQVTATAGDVSTPVFLPRRIKDVTVKAIPGGGGSALVEFTLDDQSEVEANPAAADWEEWDPSTVTASTSRALAGSVTALRLSATGADAVLQVSGSTDF